MFALGHVLYQQTPRYLPAFDEILVHAEDVAAPLRLVRAETAGGMENARINEPSGTDLEAVGL